MSEPVRVIADAWYDELAIAEALGIGPDTLSKSRRAGQLKYTRRGHRTLYLGQWVIDWLSATDKQKGASNA